MLSCLTVQGSALRVLFPWKRGELPRYQDTLRLIFLFRLAVGTLSPGEEGGPSFRTWILSDSCMIVSCLAARSAFLYETEKAAALPVVKQDRLRPRTYIYWVATAIGVVRPLAGLGSMSIKNALSCYSGVFHRPWSEPLYLV